MWSRFSAPCPTAGRHPVQTRKASRRKSAAGDHLFPQYIVTLAHTTRGLISAIFA